MNAKEFPYDWEQFLMEQYQKEKAKGTADKTVKDDKKEEKKDVRTVTKSIG